MLRHPCILGGPQQRGQNFRAPSAPPYVWPVAIDLWELSGPGGGGESRTGTEETSPPCLGAATDFFGGANHL